MSFSLPFSRCRLRANKMAELDNRFTLACCSVKYCMTRTGNFLQLYRLAPASRGSKASAQNGRDDLIGFASQ
jgi:hypothetical protein